MTSAESQQKLVDAIMDLQAWQKDEDAARRGRHGRCLEAVRAAFAKTGLQLPAPMPAPNNLAISNYHVLEAQTAKFGWQSAPESDQRYALNYYHGLGWVQGHGDIPGRYAGHIAIFDKSAGKLYSSVDYGDSAYWRDHYVGSFVPAFEAPRPVVVAPEPIKQELVSVAGVKLFHANGVEIASYPATFHARIETEVLILSEVR